MLSCKQVSHLNSARLDRPLTMRERLQVWLHLKFCETCRRVLAQMRFMRQAMRRYRGDDSHRPD
jgi:hypothetical protein